MERKIEDNIFTQETTMKNKLLIHREIKESLKYMLRKAKP